MKKNYVFLNIFVIIVAVFAGYNVYLSQTNPTISDVVLANVEALANEGDSGGGESGFRWDGTDWDTDEHWYNTFGGDWRPVLHDCTVTIGVDCGIVINITKTGQMVTCSDGSGNCVDGSGCAAG